MQRTIMLPHRWLKISWRSLKVHCVTAGLFVTCLRTFLPFLFSPIKTKLTKPYMYSTEHYYVRRPSTTPTEAENWHTVAICPCRHGHLNTNNFPYTVFKLWPKWTCRALTDLISSSVRVELLPSALSRTTRSFFNLRSSSIRLCIDCIHHTHM